MKTGFAEPVDLLLDERAYRSFFEESRDMVCISSPDGRILDVNKAGVALLGYDSKSQFLALGTLSKLYQNPKNLGMWRRLMSEQGFVKDFESTLVKKNGEIIAAIETSCVLRDARGKVHAYAGIIRDVTKSVKSNTFVHKQYVALIDSLQDVKRTQPKLIQQEKLASIGQLAAGIAHELNNPIGFISSNFSSLKSYLGVIKQFVRYSEKILVLALKGGNGGLQEHARAVLGFRKRHKIGFIYDDIENLVAESMDGIQRITEIVKSLRNFSRIDAGNEVELYDLNDAIESTLTVAKNEIKYVADVEKELGDVPLIECVGGEINQVLLNIIINAAQAIKSQRRSDRGSIRVRTSREGDFVACEVWDDGPGVKPENIHRIFDPFFTTKEAGKGIGLGLSISYDIVVHKHKGEISVESGPGLCTKFTVKLPVKSRMDARDIAGYVDE